MRLLLDECVPAVLQFDFAGHQARTVTHAGFSGFKNGKLLEAMGDEFDVLVTVDKSISKQQNLEKLKSLNLSILLLRAKTNRYEDLTVLTSRPLKALKTIKIGEVVEIKNEKNSGWIL